MKHDRLRDDNEKNSVKNMQTPNRREFLITASTAATMGLAGCTDEISEDDPLRLAYGEGFVTFQPLVGALTLDYVQDNVVPNGRGEEYEVDDVLVGGSNAIVNSMAADEADGGVVGFTSLSPAFEQGALDTSDVSITYPSNIYESNIGHADPYYSAEGSGITDWDDIPGSTFAINSVGSGSDIAARLALQNNGIDPETDVDIVEIPFGDMTSALREGRIDIGTFVSPFMLEVIDDPGVNHLFDYSTPFGATMTFFGAFRNDALEAKSSQFEALFEDVWATMKWYHNDENIDEVARELSNASGLPEEDIRTLQMGMKGPDYPGPDEGKIGVYNPHRGWEIDAEEYINPGVEGMVEAGYLSDPIDYSEMVNQEYIPDESYQIDEILLE